PTRRSSDLAPRRLAPRSNRVTTTRSTTFTATMRVIDRVHCNAANVRTLATPYRTTGLTVVDVAVVRVGHCADRSETGTWNQTLFTGVEAQNSHALIATDQLSIGASRTSNLTALARLQFDVVNNRTNRHRSERHCVARLHVNRIACNDLVANSETLRSQDVCQFTVFVTDQRDERSTVRIVFQAFDSADNVKLAALEIDETVRTLVTTALKANSDTTSVVTATLLGQTFGQGLDRLALVEFRTVHDDQLTLAWRDRIKMLECHCLLLHGLSETGRNVDALAFSQSNDRFLDV